ncbi:hypothetical protein Csa_011121 [Cucumis sativus]|uniref:Uncharacterized protein n=1 Tax=Cucumis sativus TaxID=3659 RepID=A0A0A0L7P9_CUCSA|nr:hypothetical protein Csa_011121 [Cucumis sativus]
MNIKDVYEHINRRWISAGPRNKHILNAFTTQRIEDDASKGGRGEKRSRVGANKLPGVSAHLLVHLLTLQLQIKPFVSA